MGGILFDGQTVIRPQVKVRVDAQGLVPTVLGSANVIMAFGSATGGEPKKVLTFSNPQEAEAVLRSGDLLEAIKRMYGASDENAGASTVRAVRIDPASKGTLNLLCAAPSTGLTLTSLDWGLWTTGIQAKVEAGSVSGKKVTIQDTASGLVEVFDNLADVAAAVAAINNTVSGSSLVSAALVAEGTLANVAFAALTGGADGTATNSDWSDGFDLINPNPSDIYYPATHDASVHALLVTQVNTTSGLKKGGICVVGVALGEDAADVSARAEVWAASQGRVIVCAPGLKVFDANGDVVTLGSYITMAPEVAGLLAGLPIQRAMTYKTISGLGLEVDFTQSDLDLLEQNGVLVAENVPNKGLRIVHGQTTHTSSLNPLYREASVRRIADLISLSLKEGLEKFVGEPGTTFTVQSIKAKAEAIMMEAQTNSLITDGVDNAGNPQKAYRNIVVRFNSASGIAYAEVECSPVTPVNYILVTAHFRATNIVA